MDIKLAWLWCLYPNVKTVEPIESKIVEATYKCPREGLWLVKVKKLCPEKMQKFIIFKNAPI